MSSFCCRVAWVICLSVWFAVAVVELRVLKRDSDVLKRDSDVQDVQNGTTTGSLATLLAPEDSRDDGFAMVTENAQHEPEDLNQTQTEGNISQASAAPVASVGYEVDSGNRGVEVENKQMQALFPNATDNDSEHRPPKSSSSLVQSRGSPAGGNGESIPVVHTDDLLGDSEVAASVDGNLGTSFVTEILDSGRNANFSAVTEKPFMSAIQGKSLPPQSLEASSKKSVEASSPSYQILHSELGDNGTEFPCSTLPPAWTTNPPEPGGYEDSAYESPDAVPTGETVVEHDRRPDTMIADWTETTSAMPSATWNSKPVPATENQAKSSQSKPQSTESLNNTTPFEAKAEILSLSKKATGVSTKSLVYVAIDKPGDAKRRKGAMVPQAKFDESNIHRLEGSDIHSKSESSADDFACGKYQPKYKVVGNTKNYQIRLYRVSAWLSLNLMTNNRILAELEATAKLQRYFRGENEAGIHLDPSCPILTQIKYKGLSISREKIGEYAVSFFLPWDGASEIPSPSDSELLVDVDEERTIFVHSFRARVWEVTDAFLQEEAKKLFLELRNEGEAFLSNYFYLASYAKSRTSTEDARYELWIYGTQFQSHHSSVAFRRTASNQPLSDVTQRTRARVCKGFECPKFDVVSVHKAGIQKRRYYSARFATYMPDFCSFTKASIWKAFMPLHLYKHGVNSHFEVIGATRPAGVVHVREHADLENATCGQTFSVSLYLPKRLHTAPPAAGPATPRIKITELDNVILYVQSVGGFLLAPERIHREVAFFRQRLQQQQLCFKENEYYLVVYDYITRFHGRLNEIWAVADRCPDTL